MTPFTAIKITDRVYWVGAIDWGLRDFHGYGTSRGTTYNAFLILGEHPILIDTVKAPFYQEMLARIQSVIEPQQIEYIVSNHAEMDHSGCLNEAVASIQPRQVFASQAGVLALQEQLHGSYELTAVCDGDKLQLGEHQLQFVATKMLHWPDSMFTYYANDKVLFSQDGFGMHLATSKLWVAENAWGIVKHEAAKYFANILLPYAGLVTKLLANLPALELEVIAPDHGPLWARKEIPWILESWQTWALQKYYPKAVIIYDTMWQSTAKMTQALAEGLISSGITTQVMPLGLVERSDVALELLDAGALIVGSPTLNQGMFPTVADVLCYLKGLKPRNLLGQVFGSYGWAGEATKLLEQELKAMQVTFVGDPLSVKYVPDLASLQRCKNLGQSIAQKLQGVS